MKGPSDPKAGQREETSNGRGTEASRGEDRDLLTVIVKETLQQVLEAEMDEAPQAGKGRTRASRRSRRSYFHLASLPLFGKAQRIRRIDLGCKTSKEEIVLHILHCHSRSRKYSNGTRDGCHPFAPEMELR